MAETSGDFRPFSELEALVRSAGDYVRASDDLRPRVLESARSASGERRAQRRIGQMAVWALAFAVLTAAIRQQPEWTENSLPAADQTARLLSQTPRAAALGDSSWDMVDSFTALRRRQAELLRLEL
jgi:hypothetical protein